MLSFTSLFSSKNEPKKKLKTFAEEAEIFYNDASYSRDALFEYLKKANEEVPNDCEILWRLARAAYDCAEKKGTSLERKKELIYLAFEIIQLAMRIDEHHFAVHKWWYDKQFLVLF